MDSLAQMAARVDPIFLGELALEMHMPVGEMCERMDLHELVAFWPAFFADKRNQDDRQQQEAEQQRKRFG